MRHFVGAAGPAADADDSGRRASFPRYRAPSARRDLVAGVTVAALALPSAMAYAEVAGLSPVNGLYALLLPTVAYVLLGSSRQLIVGPEGSISTLVAVGRPAARRRRQPRCGRAGGDAGAPRRGSASRLAWVLRLGWIADYFSRPVLVGYIHGVAVDPHHRPAREAARSLDRRHATRCRSSGRLCASSTSVSGLDRRPRPPSRSRRSSRSALVLPQLPAALLVVVAAIALSWALDLQAHGVAVVGADSRRAAELRCAEPRLAGRRPPRAGRGRHLPRLVRRRDPHRALLRREAQPARARLAGAARDGRRQRRGRRHPGLLRRRERLAHGGERRHGRAQPGRRPRRRGHRRS